MAEAIVRKGKRKYARKLKVMPTHYEAAKDRAIAGYRDVGFVAEIVGAYEEAWPDMITSYKEVVKPGLEDKWAKKYSRKMFGREIT